MERGDEKRQAHDQDAAAEKTRQSVWSIDGGSATRRPNWRGTRENGAANSTLGCVSDSD